MVAVCVCVGAGGAGGGRHRKEGWLFGWDGVVRAALECDK